jgi:hypothetical protein
LWERGGRNVRAIPTKGEEKKGNEQEQNGNAGIHCSKTQLTCKLHTHHGAETSAHVAKELIDAHGVSAPAFGSQVAKKCEQRNRYSSHAHTNEHEAQPGDNQAGTECEKHETRSRGYGCREREGNP